MDDQNQIDQRYLPRWETRNRVALHLANSPQHFEAYTKDISCAGARLETPKGLNPGQQVDLKIYMHDGICVEARGQIVWIKPHAEEETDEAGIHFYNMPEHQQNTILEYAFEIVRDPRKIWFKEWR
ncbi:MAG: PilZ domain-containing protein [Candidatus Omnitrophica bacterium]|nr:PilZ domain-containing protein [Candidatus Omnitrophota bacterium]